MIMSVSLDDYVKHLQKLQGQGHGPLPVCFCDEDGWEAVSSPSHLPYLTEGHYKDKTSTPWRWKAGQIIAL